MLTIVFLLANGSEEAVISANMQVSTRGTEVRLVPSQFGPGSQLKYKHAVRALYEACFAVSVPCCRHSLLHVARLYDGLYLQNQLIGFLSWRSIDSVEGEANTTLDTVDATNLTGILQIGNHEGPNSVQKRSSSFTDHNDPNLVIFYTYSDRKCSVLNLFSAVIEGMAIVSSKDKDDIADYINSYSARGDFTINIDATQTTTFRWIDMLRCLRDLWDLVNRSDEVPADMNFEVLYRGSRVAEGHTLTI